MKEDSFLEFLTANQHLTAEQSDLIRRQLALGHRLHEALRRFFTDEEILEFKSIYFGIDRIRLADETVDSFALSLIPEQLAAKHNIIPLRIDGDRLAVAMGDPGDRRAVEDIELYSGLKILPYLAETEEIKVAIRELYMIRPTEEESPGKYGGASYSWKIDESPANRLEGPVVRLVDSLFRQAVVETASDIHWEPGEESYKVKFRIDGQLEIKTLLPLSLARSV
jgi:type IV pilus assembly protein PilB